VEAGKEHKEQNKFTYIQSRGRLGKTTMAARLLATTVEVRSTDLVRPYEIFGGCDGFLHQGKMPKNERASEETKEIPNELNRMARIFCLTKFAPACRPSSKLSCGFGLLAPAVAPAMAPPTMQMAKYKTTNRKTNRTIEVKMRNRSVIFVGRAS
jgi:hypothetical protein